jgi:hypothetical protein
MTVTTEDGNRQNVYAKEPRMEVVDKEVMKEAELLNGRLAMLGFVALMGALLTTGQIVPGIF